MSVIVDLAVFVEIKNPTKMPELLAKLWDLF